MTVLVLAVIAFTTLAVATVDPDLDSIRLIGLAAIAIIATDLLARGGEPR